MPQDALIELPIEVEKRLKHLGAEGANWRARLPATIKRLQTQWSLTFGAVMHGGSEALILEASNPADGDLVLKLLLPTVVEPGQSEVIANKESNVLLAADGCGYVRVFNIDEATGAMLQPRLGAALGAEECDPATQQRTLCETLKRAWQVSGAGLDLQTGAEKARWLRAFIVELAAKHGQYISAEALSVALDFTERRERAHAEAVKVLVHGDPHVFNALRTDTGDYVLIDPDGLHAEAEYDMGVIMREASAELLERDHAPIARGKARCERLARLSGTQPLAIWQWGYIERVSTGLYTLELDMPDYGKPALQVANSWAQQGARQCFETA